MRFKFAPIGLNGQWTCGECNCTTIQRYRPDKCQYCHAIPEEFKCPDCGSPAKLSCDTPICKMWQCSKSCGDPDMDIEERRGPIPPSTEEAA